MNTNTLAELKTMIAAAIARNPAGKARMAELKAIQWRIVDADGNYLQGVNSLADLMGPPSFGPQESAAVFDGRDNETQKLRYFTIATGRALSVEILPQLCHAAKELSQAELRAIVGPQPAPCSVNNLAPSLTVKFLIQFELEGRWETCATRSEFRAAKSKARSEYKAMRGARMFSIIRDGDPELLRRTQENNFQL